MSFRILLDTTTPADRLLFLVLFALSISGIFFMKELPTNSKVSWDRIYAKTEREHPYGVMILASHGLAVSPWTKVKGDYSYQYGGFKKNTNNFAGKQWELVKDLKGPSHSQGGIDLTIDNGKINMSRKGAKLEAKHGMVIPPDDGPPDMTFEQFTKYYDKDPNSETYNIKRAYEIYQKDSKGFDEPGGFAVMEDDGWHFRSVDPETLIFWKNCVGSTRAYPGQRGGYDRSRHANPVPQVERVWRDDN